MGVKGSWTRLALVALLLAAAAARRSEQDFEFDDDADAAVSVSRRYIYDPHNPLCKSLVCKKREVCALRDADTALCLDKREVLRRGDSIVASSESVWRSARPTEGEDDDVFYDAAPRPNRPIDRPIERPIDRPNRPDRQDQFEHAERPDREDRDEIAPEHHRPRCVGCGVSRRAQFVCGSDNRTYSSLCRLDLHNCVHRDARVRLACRGFCPCPEHKEWRRRRPETRNEVIPARANRRRLSQGKEGCALDKMANRLLDWFSVLLEEAGATPPPVDGFPRDCKPEVRWMFLHLDADGDGLLSADNLYSLRHDEREQCLRPFLSACGGGDNVDGDGGGEGGGGVSRSAWCACLRRAARPCTALARALPQPAPGAYVPSCDTRGYYRPRQCHSALGVCWCVDRHGVEVPHSRGKGAPPCPGDKSSRRTASNEVDDDEGAPDDDEDAPSGSGDSELRF